MVYIESTGIEWIDKSNFTGKEVVELIEKLWYAKELSDKYGFIEEKPKIQNKKLFKTIRIYTQNNKCYVCNLSLEEYKSYRLNKFRMMGLEK